MKIFNNPIISSILRRRNISSEDVPQINSDSLVGLDANKILYEKNRRTFSVKLEGYVEPYEVGGIGYTMFYTDVDHNLRVGERVFIVGGFYDSDDLIKVDKFNPLADGYKVLFVDRTKVALDIEYTGDLPSKTDPIDDFIKVYVASSQDEFDYLCQTYTNRGLNLDISGDDVPVSSNRFSYAYSSNSGITYSTNTILYLNGTFSNSGQFGINPTTLGNSFVILDRNSGNLVDITSDLLSGNYGQYLSDILVNNDRIKVLGTSFAIGDSEFRKNSVYYYNYDTGYWEIDREYDPAFITEQNFRRGIFRKGNFNQGVFGQYDEQIVYDGAEVKFNLGTLVNVRWTDGDINSGRSDSDSYFTAFDNGVPNIRLNAPNNGGFGYTFVYNVVMEKSNITSGVFVDSVFGSQSNINAVANYISGNPATYSVKITGGTFFNSELTNCDISGANFVSSVVSNSNILSSKSINSEIERSVFLRSKFTSDKIIKIDKYQESEILWWNGSNQETFRIHKFYFSEQNFNRLKNLKNFYFDGIVLDGGSNPYKLLNFFDEKFTLGSYTHSYDSIAPGGKVGAKVIIQTSTIEDNLKFFSGVTGSNSLIEEDNFEYGMPSLDILCNNLNIGFSGRTYQAFNVNGFDQNLQNLLSIGGFGSYILASFRTSDNTTYGNISFGYDYFNFDLSLSNISEIVEWVNEPFSGSQSISTWYHTDIWGDPVIFTDSQIDFSGLDILVFDISNVFIGSIVVNKINVQDPYINISGAYILDSDFKSGLFKESEWITGNYANYNDDYSIKTNDFGYYRNLGVTGSSLTLNIGPQNRYDIFQSGDIGFIRGLYFDPIAASQSGELIKLSEVYTLSSSFDDLNGRNYVLSGVTPSGSFTDFFGQDWIITPNAENNFNYLSPVKFENSKILSGVIRRGYFENCVFDNILFNLTDRDLKDIPNARKLLVTDTIFHNSGNTFKNGIYVNSSILSGNDKFENGIVFNSIWNGRGFNYKISQSGGLLTHQNIDFQNGIFTKSKWSDGNWLAGQFYMNKTNAVGTYSVYDDAKEVYYSKNQLTRWSWVNGEFRSGIFEKSNWESGKFFNGEFFFSNFLSGESFGGVFGRSNLKTESTRVLSGSFSNSIVVNAEFRSTSPKGESISGPTPSYKIEWYSGKFDGGIFGVDVQYPVYEDLVFEYPYESIWYNGDFNGGKFADISKWKLGRFNGGEFISYYGYPEVRYPYQYFVGTYSTQDRFAWEDGEFNGGKFGNFSTGSNSTWYTGEFNGGVFAGRYWRTGVFYNGKFIGSGSGKSTMKDNVSNYIWEFSDNFYGYWRDGVVTENKDDHILNKNFYTKLERESTKVEKKRNATLDGILWRGGIFQHSSGYMNNSVWLDGVFQKGFFTRSSFNPFVNYISNGGFTNGLSPYWNVVRGDSGPIFTNPSQLSYSLINTSGQNLNWYGRSNDTIVYQVTSIDPGQIYSVRIKINSINELQYPIIRYGNWITPINGNFNDSSGWTLDGDGDYTVDIVTGNPGYIFGSFSGTQSYCEFIYEDTFPPEFIGSTVSVTIHYYNYVGDDCVIEIYDTLSNTTLNAFPIGQSLGYTDPQSAARINQDITPTGPNFGIRFSDTSNGFGEIKMQGILVTGNNLINLSPPFPQEFDVQFETLNQFFAIEFVQESFNPILSGGQYVHTWPSPGSMASIDVIELVSESGGFNNSDTCLWENGTLNDSEFFVSKWENGNWIYGTGYGMIWKNGVANYMNAENIYWEGGVWKNGNWNGAPFDANWVLSGSTSVIPGFAFEILQNIANYRDSIDDPEYTSIFINNAFLSTGSDSSIIDDPEIELDGILLPEGVNNSDYVSQSTTSSVFAQGSGLDWTYAKYYTDWNGGSQELNDLVISGTYGYSSSNSSVPNFCVVTPEPLNYGTNSVVRFKEYSGYFMPFPLNGLISSTNFLPSSGTFVLHTPNGNDSSIQTSPPTDISFNSIQFDDSDSLSTPINIYQAKAYGNYKFTFNFSWQISDRSIFDYSVGSDSKPWCRPVIEFLRNGSVVNNASFDFKTNLGIYGPLSISRQINLEIGDYVSLRVYWNYYKDNPTGGLFNSTSSSNVSIYPRIVNNYSVKIEIVYQSGLNGISGDPYFLPQTTSQKLYTRGEVGGTYSRYIFSEPGFSYNIKIKYACSYGMSKNKPQSRVDFMVRCGTLSLNPIEELGGGFARIVSSVMTGITVAPGTNGLGVDPSGTYYVGSTGIRELNYTFTPETIFTSDDDRKCLSIQRLATSDSLTRLHILSIEVVKTSISYDYEYNNATFSGISLDIDDINIPDVGIIGGGDSNGDQISISFGNGIFKSGRFSSVWENGVWNQGLRFDKEMVYFTNLKLFGGTGKPLGFGGVVANSGSNDQAFFNNTVGNQTYTESVVSYSKNVWIITLQMSQGTITSESTNGTFETNQGSLLPSSKFSIGDRVAVGNLAMVDSNLQRKLIRDAFTVVAIDDIERTVSLQLTLNFPIFAIKRDSDNHMIYVTKNIWLNGAFLNGFYRGVWNNGLFKGGIFITKMVDSQWIDGTFDGGWFRGLTSSMISTNSSDPQQINSALIQNFTFYGNDSKSLPYVHEWRSWVDVNFYDDSTVTIGRNTITYDSGEIFSHLGVTFSLGEYSQTNYFSYPTYDVLSSKTIIRNNYNNNLINLSLGQKWLEYVDYIGKIGEFENYYNTRVQTGYDNLVNDGFTWVGRVPLPDENIFYSQSGSNQIGFSATGSSLINLTTSYSDVAFPDIDLNSSGAYDSTDGSYTAYFAGTYTLKVYLDYTAFSVTNQLYVRFEKYDSNSNSLSSYEELFIPTSGSGSIDHTANIDMIAGEFVKVRIKRGFGIIQVTDRAFLTLSTPTINVNPDARGPVRFRSNTNASNEERLEINFDPDIITFAGDNDFELLYGVSLDHKNTLNLPRERYNYISFDLEGQMQTTGLIDNQFIFDQNKMIFTFVVPQNTPVRSDGNNLLQRIPDSSLSISGSASSVSSLLVMEKTTIKEYFYGKKKMNLLSVGKLLGPGNFSDGGSSTASNFLSVGSGNYVNPSVVENNNPYNIFGAFPMYSLGGGYRDNITGIGYPSPQYLDIERSNLISWAEYISNWAPNSTAWGPVNQIGFNGGPFNGSVVNQPSGNFIDYLQNLYGSLPKPSGWLSSTNSTGEGIFDFFGWYGLWGWYAYETDLQFGSTNENTATEYGIPLTWINNDFSIPGFDNESNYNGSYQPPTVYTDLISSPNSVFPKFEDLFFEAPSDGKYTFALTASIKTGYPGWYWMFSDPGYDPDNDIVLSNSRYVFWNVGFVKRSNQDSPIRYYSISASSSSVNSWSYASGLKITSNGLHTQYGEVTMCLKAGERVDIKTTFSLGGDWVISNGGNTDLYSPFYFYMMTPNITKNGSDGPKTFTDTRWYFSCTGFVPYSCDESDDAGLTPKTKLLLSNLKFIETDMVPFFQLVRTDSTNLDLQGNPIDIDTSIQTPLQGIAPFINTNNNNFQFINNINFSGSIFVPYTPPETTTVTEATTSNISSGSSSAPSLRRS